MISVSKALSIISEVLYTPKTKTVLLKDTNGLRLSKNIPTPIDMPPFRQSAMDGYALLLHDKNTYQIIGEVKAGDADDYSLLPGQGVRIFTGARVPDNANTIVIQEKVIRSENTITINEEIHQNQNIRATGEQIKKGDIALEKGTKISPAGIGFLAGLGITDLEVFIPPSVAIITTGNELIAPGQKLQQGKIYESNSVQLQAVLEQFQIKEINKYIVQDEYESTKETIRQAIENNDLVLISGGISVGDYDFVKEALSELGTEELFYKIKQKPGKPLFFGKNKETFIFALPGNPASSLTCFYIYVITIIQKIMGDSSSDGLKRTMKSLTKDFIKKGDRAQFLKAKVSNETVEILDGQSSAMLYSYAVANALVFIPENISKVDKDSLVETILLPD
ncbi:molybdopterin molybdotransferase MoeA [Aquimarina sp. MMG015]|uniref:molybdopterin molybdotransferase MoeA n=1 Tax=unclassified Aquimarina TaxID=2627091 RepID=UPI000E46FD31|nr:MULTISPECIES: gephyrin-like molybdotransferase Glp [unclassified Aquimarina]AXT55890.1 molybdopterin molybdenumtransferase MoeA [Aquimarina sp. AD1]MBQ4805331.1 molybdopterin molybdotransferase MoeA [Aquimarina sp. MMG015]RKN16700.1 molybdopterin molybdenumtransferase MoeA [Aquimarina sp. AD1]